MVKIVTRKDQSPSLHYTEYEYGVDITKIGTCLWQIALSLDGVNSPVILIQLTTPTDDVEVTTDTWVTLIHRSVSPGCYLEQCNEPTCNFEITNGGTLTAITKLGMIDFEVYMGDQNLYLCTKVRAPKMVDPIPLTNAIIFRMIFSGAAGRSTALLSATGIEIHRIDRSGEVTIYLAPFVFQMGATERVRLYENGGLHRDYTARDFKYSDGEKMLQLREIGEFRYFSSRDEKVWVTISDHPLHHLARGVRIRISQFNCADGLKPRLEQLFANIMLRAAIYPQDNSHRVLQNMVDFHQNIGKMSSILYQLELLGEDPFGLDTRR